MAKFPWASTVAEVIPKALNHPPRESLEEVLERAVEAGRKGRHKRLARAYDRTPEQVEAAVKRAREIVGDGRDA